MKQRLFSQYSTSQSLLIMLLILATLSFFFAFFYPNTQGPNVAQTLQLYFVGQQRVVPITTVQYNCDLSRITASQCDSRIVSVRYTDGKGALQTATFEMNSSVAVGQMIKIRYIAVGDASNLNSYRGDLILPEAEVEKAGISFSLFLLFYALLFIMLIVVTRRHNRTHQGQYETASKAKLRRKRNAQTP